MLSHVCGVGAVDMRCPCVVGVSVTSDFVLNHIAGAIIDHSRSATDKDPNVKSRLCGGPRPPTGGTDFAEWVKET